MKAIKSVRYKTIRTGDSTSEIKLDKSFQCGKSEQIFAFNQIWSTVINNEEFRYYAKTRLKVNIGEQSEFCVCFWSTSARVNESRKLKSSYACDRRSCDEKNFKTVEHVLFGKEVDKRKRSIVVTIFCDGIFIMYGRQWGTCSARSPRSPSR